MTFGDLLQIWPLMLGLGVLLYGIGFAAGYFWSWVRHPADSIRD